VSENRQIVTLKQVASSIRKTLDSRYQQAYWVKAEMHKLNLFPSGHAFPELVQKEDGKIVAQLSGTIWKQHVQRINQQFIALLKEPLKEGSVLLLQVRIVFSETYGLSLHILDIDPSYTLGELQRERNETLRQLSLENLTNRNQQLVFPLLPQRIAIISADTSKGLSDFMKVLDGNAWGYCYFTMLFQAYLQGDVAVQSIIHQLKRIEKVKEHFDVVVIVRGGGGEVGLSCYNNLELCKAIASFPLPVLTGIGHSTNLTVAELIAFRNAITPTELADFLLQAFHDYSMPIQEATKITRRYGQQLIQYTQQQFSAEIKYFKHRAELYLATTNNTLVSASKTFKNSVVTLLLKRNNTLTNAQQRISIAAQQFLKKQREKQLEQAIQLPLRVNQWMQHKQHSLEEITTRVRLLDPINILKRGFSITTINGKLLDKQSVLKEGDTLITQTADRMITSDVTHITTKHDS
jgi:exodeoxyribonuclease VII large subunit